MLGKLVAPHISMKDLLLSRPGWSPKHKQHDLLAILSAHRGIFSSSKSAKTKMSERGQYVPSHFVQDAVQS